MRERYGRRSGIAGEMSVSVRTSSGWRAASSMEIAPPMELPNRWTGPASRPRTKRATASACAGIEESKWRGGAGRGGRRRGRGGAGHGGGEGGGGLGAAEAGEVDGGAGHAGGQLGGEVGRVGRGAAESVHVDGGGVGVRGGPGVAGGGGGGRAGGVW